MSIRNRMERVAGAVVRTRPGTSEPGDLRSDESSSRPAAPTRVVEIVVYAEDCVLAGSVELTADRLSDMLNDCETLELSGATVNDLAGGQPFELETVELNRDDILLIHVGGPRGDPGRRHRTRQLPILAKAGPFSIRGYVHSLPGTDAIASLRRRQPMFALTDAIIEYTIQSRPQERRAGVLIVNREAMNWVVEGHDAEVMLPDMPVEPGGPRVKDFTGEVFELDADWNA